VQTLQAECKSETVERLEHDGQQVDAVDNRGLVSGFANSLIGFFLPRGWLSRVSSINILRLTEQTIFARQAGGGEDEPIGRRRGFAARETHWSGSALSSESNRTPEARIGKVRAPECVRSQRKRSRISTLLWLDHYAGNHFY